jgi:hypothetical protein
VRTRASAGRNWALGAAAIVVGTTLLYVWIISNESGNDPARVASFGALLVLALACSIGGAMLRTAESRHLAAAGGTGLLLSMGAVALFSIGALLFIAAGLLIMAIAAEREERRSSSKILVIAAFAVGAALPWVVVSTI